MSFTDHLSTWSAEDLSHLMAKRPDLLPASDRGLEAVARKAGTAMSLGRALVAADVGMLVVAEALVSRFPATVDDIDELLGTGDPTAVSEAIDRLRRTGIVVVEDGVIFPIGSLPDLLHRPLGLGPSFEGLADNLSTETTDRLAAATRSQGTGHRSPTIRAIAHRLREPSVLVSLLADAPAESRDLLETLVAHRSPAIPLPTGYPYRGLERDDPLAWLVENGLVIAVTEAGAELPREIVMASMTDGLAPNAVLRAPELQAVDGLSSDVVSGSATDAANLLLHGAETLLRMIGDGEVSMRKAGGVGPREIKRLAKLCRLPAIDVARLFELLAVARLLKVSGARLDVSDLAGRWWAMARRRRYLVLVRAWLGSDRFLSRALVTDVAAGGSGGDRLVALGDAEPVAAVAAGRAVTLSTVCRLPAEAAFVPDQLAESVVWQGPNLWGAGEPPPEILVDWTLAEAELLGLMSGNAPAPMLRAVVAADEAELERLAREAMAEDQDKFVLQSDMTAVAFGPLTPAISRSLIDMTERADAVGESRAPTFRFSESSIRQAFDRGWNQESITGFLNEHSLAGIPQPLDYLLADVARRYGSIRVMPAQSVIVTIDDIAAVEIASERKAAKLGLRLIAPTVLTSPLDPVTVTEALRAIGLFPTLDGSSIIIDAQRKEEGGADNDEPLPGDLPADWTGPPIPSGPFADEISDAVSLLLESGDGEAPVEPGREVDQANRRLQAFWGRAAIVDAATGDGIERLHGTLVGLGQTVSLLTVDGIIDVPRDAVLAISDPRVG